MRFSLLLSLGAAGAHAAKMSARPSFEMGQAMGNAISEGVSENPAGFAAEMEDAFSAKIRNPAMDAAVASANKKYGSFLQRPALNLHVGETVSSSLDSEKATARAALAELEHSELEFADKMVHAYTSFLSTPADAQREASSFHGMKAVVNYYAALIDQGGLSARKGLAGLLNLASLPNGKAALSLVSPLLVRKASNLAQKESTPDDTRNLAGSLVTYITGLPVSFQSSDVSTGSYGHTSIVVPAPSRIYGADETISQLSAGAHGSDTAAGDYYH